MAHLKSLKWKFFSLFAVFVQCASAQTIASENALLRNMLKPSVKLLYLSDSDHGNPRIEAALQQLITAAAKVDKKIDCLLLEADKKIYQPQLLAYQKGQSWETSVELANSQWQQLTGRPYKVSKNLVDAARSAKLKVFAVDWDDSSETSAQMTMLFQKGFVENDLQSLKDAFQIGVTVRNQVMAKNIQELFTAKNNRPPRCRKAIMTVGGLHLKEQVVMGDLGKQQFVPIASFLILKNQQQASVGVYDCKEKKNADQNVIDLCNSNPQKPGTVIGYPSSDISFNPKMKAIFLSH